MASFDTANPLSTAIVSQSDLVRLLREVEQFDGQYAQAALQERVKSKAVAVSAHTSLGLQQLADQSGISLSTDEGRQELRDTINDLLRRSPQLHISFASEPPQAHLRTVVEWLRHNIHASVLVRTSVQPAIIAGCIIRSSNRVLDLSLRRSFEEALPQLTKEMRAL